jgi:hypothetical protein
MWLAKLASNYEGLKEASYALEDLRSSSDFCVFFFNFLKANVGAFHLSLQLRVSLSSVRNKTDITLSSGVYCYCYERSVMRLCFVAAFSKWEVIQV